ncbi:MAG: radical SAM protein [Calditrichae bacterium]|nr:radical SAM protein [Calditrichota bacterium]MCB9059685.1 radical SAM protein [Calditrichia bacterium]
MELFFTKNLESCVCCPRNCGTNRLQGKVGVCKIPAEVYISHAGLHFGEEPPISGTKGSGTIFFSGCNLRCVFCQNYQISQEFKREFSVHLTISDLADKMLELQNLGAHNINFVSPSHVIYQMADAIVLAKQKGLKIPVVYNSNGYDSVDALRKISGLVDIYLPDIKYLETELALKYSRAKNYADVIPGVLEEMLCQAGHLECDENGIAQKGLLVRHLVLPNHVENSKRCLDLIAGLSRYTYVSIMSQYSPQFKAFKYPDINRTLSEKEYNEIIDYTEELGLENAFTQELISQEKCLPDFALDTPFNFNL